MIVFHSNADYVCSFCRKTTLTKHQRRSHRFDVGSPGGSSDVSDDDTLESPQSPSQVNANLWNNLRSTNGPVHPGMPHRSQSMNNIVQTEQNVAYRPSLAHAHRYSFSDNSSVPANVTNEQFSNTYTGHRAENEYHQVQNSVTPINTQHPHATPVAVSNTALAAAHLQSSPSTFSPQSSPQEASPNQDNYYHQGHPGQIVGYRHVQGGLEPKVHYVQAPRGAPPQMVAHPQAQQVVYTHPPPMVAQQMPPPQHAHQEQTIYENMPYHEPVAVMAVPQTYHLPGYPYAVTRPEDWYKPEDLVMVAPSNEFMTPSARAMHEMSNGF